jgi:hypothetical protein
LVHPAYAFQMGTYSFAVGKTWEILASATETASFDSSACTSTYDGRLVQYLLVYVTVTAASGTSEKLYLYLNGSDDDATYVVYDSIGIPVISTTGNYAILVKGPFAHKYISMSGTITGTTPSFTLAIEGFKFGPSVS